MAVDKAKFAFGSLANLQAAIDAGKVDPFDLLCLMDNGVPRIGWLDRNNNPVIIDTPEDEVVAVDELPSVGQSGVVYIVGKAVYIWHNDQFVAISESTDLSALESKVSTLEAEMENKANAAEVEEQINKIASEAETMKYEVFSKPIGTLVDYREKEIRVMCPANTAWYKQNVGATGDANMYYMGFKAYAPEDAVSFKEDDQEIIEDQTMYYFENNDFAGVDEFGRKYSVIWLALASYDETTNAWTYYGSQSSFDHYIGWYYSVEWYDANGVLIASDRIRINLSNEDCHLEIKPFYMADVTAEVKKYVDEQIEEIVEIPVVEF